MYLVTLANNTYQYEFVMLFTLAQALGWKIHVAGVGVEWKGWRTKMEVYAAAVKTISETEPLSMVVCADAYDVLVLRTPTDFSKIAALLTQKPIIVSAETFCGSNCRPLNYESSTQRKYANAGLLCGRAKQVSNMWHALLQTSWRDDQIALSEYMDQNTDLFFLDTEAKLLQTSTGKFKDDDISDDTIDGLGPAFLHLPGLADSKHVKQRQIYSMVLADVARRTHLDHILTTRWASRHVPFQGTLITYSLITAVVFLLIALVRAHLKT
jgi:hypothetical protein